MKTKLLRTLVPYFWGTVVTWLIGALPVLEPLHDDLMAQTPFLVELVSVLVSALWYYAFERLSPYIPDWLLRILMGSAKSPTYPSAPDAGPDPQERGGPGAHAGPVYPEEDDPHGGKHVAREG